MRAVTAAGEAAAASHRTALALHRVVRPDRLVDVIVPRRRRLNAADDIRLHTATALPSEDLRLVTGIRTTAVERSMLDFAGSAHPDALAYAIDVAVRLELTTVDQLAAFLDRRRRRGRPGVAALDRALDQTWLGVAESRYERALLDMLEEAGLGGVPQYDILDADGRFIARVDVAWPLQRVALEVDGHAFHATRDQREHDAVRQNQVLVAGWNLLRCTSDQVHRRDRSITRSVGRALREADRRR